MTEEEKATNYETLKHIGTVMFLLQKVKDDLTKRMFEHDRSKLEDPELSAFVEFTPKLKCSTYGSDEYKGFLDDMKPALKHHYENNRHHPEHVKQLKCRLCDSVFKAAEIKKTLCPKCDVHEAKLESYIGIEWMNLLDLIEMLIDWKAAGMRHEDGDIRKSLEINERRFNIPDPVMRLLENTVEYLEL